MELALKKAENVMPIERLTIDCIHLTSIGHYILAKTWMEETYDILHNNFNIVKHKYFNFTSFFNLI